MKTETKKRNKVSLTLYIVALLFACYAIFSLINSTLYISNLVSTQYITVSESMTDIISYFASSCAAYIFYAFALFGLGHLIQHCVLGKAVVANTAAPLAETEGVVDMAFESATEPLPQEAEVLLGEDETSALTDSPKEDDHEKEMAEAKTEENTEEKEAEAEKQEN